MSCSIRTQGAAGASRIAQQQRRQRFGLALRDARRRLVEQDDRRSLHQQAGEVDDAARAGRQLADELVA